MFAQIKKNLLIILFLLVCISLIWVLNQKKNFNPVLSLTTNISFKSNKNLDYNDLGSVYEVYLLLKEKDPSFNLVPSVLFKDFSVIGRRISNNKDEISVYEFENTTKAKQDFKRLSATYENRFFTYKNLVIYINNEGEILNYLKEKLND